MTQSNYIANRLGEVLLDGDWIARTNIRKHLESIDHIVATKKIGKHNSIAELTFHINYYLGGILSVLDGGELTIRDKYSFSMELITSGDEWKKLVDSFIYNSERIVAKITEIPDHSLKDPFVMAEYGTLERNIEGLIEHSYYHFGQISLLLKLVQ